MKASPGTAVMAVGADGGLGPGYDPWVQTTTPCPKKQAAERAQCHLSGSRGFYIPVVEFHCTVPTCSLRYCRASPPCPWSVLGAAAPLESGKRGQGVRERDAWKEERGKGGSYLLIAKHQGKKYILIP